MTIARYGLTENDNKYYHLSPYEIDCLEFSFSQGKAKWPFVPDEQIKMDILEINNNVYLDCQNINSEAWFAWLCTDYEQQILIGALDESMWKI